MLRKILLVNVSLAMGVLTSLFSFSSANAQTSLQNPTVRFADVLAPEWQRGDGYLIKDSVYIEGNRYCFEVETNYGGFLANGLPVLELRLNEHKAIEQLAEMSKHSLALKGAGETIRHTPRGAMTLLTDPLGSIGRIPAGIKRSVDTVFDPLEHRAGSQIRREIALSVGADPETRNPVLSELLDRMALRKGIGQIGTKVALGVALPGLGMLSTNEELREKLRRKGPRELSLEVRADLQRLGIAERASIPFAESQILTSAEKLIFVSHLKHLKGVKGLHTLVTRATDAKSEAELLSQFEQVRMLDQLHQSQVVDSIHPYKVPVARLRDGRFVGVAAVDVVYYSDDLAGYVHEFRRQNPSAEVSLLTTGNMTRSARQVMDQGKIRVVQVKHTVDR